MLNLTVKITDISGGKGKAFKAVIPELNNSIICADTMHEIFKLVPEAINQAKKYSFGVYADSVADRRNSCTAGGKRKGAKQSI